MEGRGGGEEWVKGGEEGWVEGGEEKDGWKGGEEKDEGRGLREWRGDSGEKNRSANIQGNKPSLRKN